MTIAYVFVLLMDVILVKISDSPLLLATPWNPPWGSLDLTLKTAGKQDNFKAHYIIFTGTASFQTGTVILRLP